MGRKTHNHRLDLPPLELECMRMLWAAGTGTVHQIRGKLLLERPLAYTTVMTVMNRLVQKGIAGREKRGRRYLYRPLIAEETVRDRALDRFTRNFFRGSQDLLLQYLESKGGTAKSPSEEPPAPSMQPPSVRADAARSEAPAQGDPGQDLIDPSLL